MVVVVRLRERRKGPRRSIGRGIMAIGGVVLEVLGGWLVALSYGIVGGGCQAPRNKGVLP